MHWEVLERNVNFFVSKVSFNGATMELPSPTPPSFPAICGGPSSTDFGTDLFEASTLPWHPGWMMTQKKTYFSGLCAFIVDFSLTNQRHFKGKSFQLQLMFRLSTLVFPVVSAMAPLITNHVTSKDHLCWPGGISKLRGKPLQWWLWIHVGVSKNRGTPKSSILIWFSIINNPFWGIPIFGNIHVIILFEWSDRSSWKAWLRYSKASPPAAERSKQTWSSLAISRLVGSASDDNFGCAQGFSRYSWYSMQHGTNTMPPEKQKLQTKSAWIQRLPFEIGTSITKLSK